MTPIEAAESRVRRFLTVWPVAERYAVRDGYLIPIPNGPARSDRSYPPLARPELPAEFAKLATGDAADVLAFAKTYGVLGYKDALRFPAEAVGAQDLRLYDSNAPGDPLPWIAAHARAVALVGSLANALDDPNALAALLATITVRTEDGEEELSFQCPARGHTRPGQMQMRPARTPRESALHVIAHIVNANLGGVERELVVESQPPGGALGLTSAFTPHSLTDCIYWLLADAVADGKVRACLACQRFFVSTDQRMKFCPRPMGHSGASLCLTRYKQAQYRTRHAAPPEPERAGALLSAAPHEGTKQGLKRERPQEEGRRPARRRTKSTQLAITKENARMPKTVNRDTNASTTRKAARPARQGRR